MLELFHSIDPRRSLAAAVGWLVMLLSITLALAADGWVDDVLRASLLDQRARQLDDLAAHVASRLNLNLATRIQKVRVLSASLSRELADQTPPEIRATLENVQQASPEFDWIAVATPNGYGLAGTHGTAEGVSVGTRAWFAAGLRAAPGGEVQVASVPDVEALRAGQSSPAVALTGTVAGAGGQVVGVIGAQLGERWRSELARELRQELGDGEGADVLLLGPDRSVLIGPPNLQGRSWPQRADGTQANGDAPLRAPAERLEGGSVASGRPVPPWQSHLVHDAAGTPFLVARAAGANADIYRSLGWQVRVLQSVADATRRAASLQRQIAAILVGLGLLAALIGIAVARRLTRGLEHIAQSADAIRAGTTQDIAVPRGANEAARLGQALSALLHSLQRERAALETLNRELDQRVSERTREVERLAEQSRYDGLVRERLRIARDLHDTLAHSMMAMVSETRLLRRLWASDPDALAEELERAEQAARDGLEEARAAIAKMRFNPVRDAGLAAALEEFVRAFTERTGTPVRFEASPGLGRLSDERAETLFRIAEEALRNVERHAGAREVVVSLAGAGSAGGIRLVVRDDGVGFDPDAAHPGHFGLAGLREQAQLIGAGLEITSAPGQGTTVSVRLPPDPR